MRTSLWLTGVMALAGTSIAVNNPAAKPSFAELTWYSNRQVVKSQMLSKGYAFVREVKDRGAIDVEYSGRIQGINATILHSFNSKNQLVKSQIIFDKSAQSTLLNNFQNIKGSLDNKYGSSVDLTNISEFTSKEYDFSVESELGRGKRVNAAWSFTTNRYFIGLSIIQPYLNNREYFVSLAYESPAWGAELDRRNSGGDL
ncbi:hypothetical protein [Deinococcus yunweiensis]|uniref:hypothetical protein n=1 Tax=Deinococcus yunweiensis TaxID=367282 RepID=UPI00398ED471